MAIFNVSRSFTQSVIAGFSVVIGFFALLFATSPHFSNFSASDVVGGVVHADAPVSCSCTDSGCSCGGDGGCGCDGCGCAG